MNEQKLVPELRFPGFEGEWSKVRIGKHLHPITQKVPSNTSLKVFSSTREGLKPQKDYYNNRELANDGEYGVVPEGAFVYRHMSDDLTFKFNLNTLGLPLAVSKEYPVFKTNNKELQAEFLLLKLNYGRDFKKFAVLHKMGGTRTRLYFKSLCSWITLLPHRDEQQKIAEFLSSVDAKLAKLSRKKTLLEDYKRGLMQQIFSQKLRFKQDDGSAFPEWKSNLLSEVASFSKGKNISKDDVVENGETLCIRYGELYTQYSEKIQKVVSRTNLPKSELVFSSRQDVIIPSSGESHLDIATASCVLEEGIALGGDLNIIRGNFNGVFLAYYLNIAKKKDIACLAQGNSVVHLYISQLSALKVNLPSIKEQQKIADFLSSIDQKIDSVAKQIEQLEVFKKGLLQKLFV